MNKITSNEFEVAKKIIADIKEMFEKHREVKWYGTEQVEVFNENIDIE